jgi:hypothetical protein
MDVLDANKAFKGSEKKYMDYLKEGDRIKVEHINFLDEIIDFKS